MHAVGRGEQEEEQDLQGREGGVCREEEGWCRAGGEDGFPQVGEEVGHGFRGAFRAVSSGLFVVGSELIFFFFGGRCSLVVLWYME